MLILPIAARVLPFLLLLGAMSVLPLFHHQWWERRYPLVVLALSLPVLAGYLLVVRNYHRLLELLGEYLGFITLLASLYVVAGGIRIRVVGPPRPITNIVILFCGALLANIVGTTGASMVLIRAYLDFNRCRYQEYLPVFFIFLVSNIGGALTPIGDPPLFLGYLKGVPFLWPISQLWWHWLTAVALVLGLFYLFDRRNSGGACISPRPTVVHIQGYRSLVVLGIILVAVFAHSPVRELTMIGAAAASYLLTRPRIHRRNRFSFRPIVEVAVLFAGVFATMAPVLDLLTEHSYQLGMKGISGFFWVPGLLSGVLDNAPTYRTFLAVAQSLSGGSVNSLLTGAPQLLKALSLGAVFFGGLTYVGNGPNMMVRSIVEKRHLPCPHFVQYILRYSLPLLVPVLILVWLQLLVSG